MWQNAGEHLPNSSGCGRWLAGEGHYFAYSQDKAGLQQNSRRNRVECGFNLLFWAWDDSISVIKNVPSLVPDWWKMKKSLLVMLAVS